MLCTDACSVHISASWNYYPPRDTIRQDGRLASSSQSASSPRPKAAIGLYQHAKRDRERDMLQTTEYAEAKIQTNLEKGALRAIEGTLQRVNYQRKELTVVALGQVWSFALDRDCQLWFDDKQAILRCFHPL